MATEQVIELGSSDDDEPEPPPKKAKPPINAMVHIPNKLPDITIKPAKANKPSPNAAVARNVSQVVKNPYSPRNVPQVVKNPYSPRNVNGRASQMTVVKRPLNIPVTKHTGMINQNNQAPVQKPRLVPILTQQYLQEQITKTLPKIKLPPGITVTKTINETVPKIKRPTVTKINKPTLINTKRIITNKQIQNKRSVGPDAQGLPFKRIKLQKPVKIPEVVNLDDETPEPSSSSSPQWYVRPEEQTLNTSMEVKNNKEPAPHNMIEITIEDSPIKPPNKRTVDIEKEISITIDDSPVKMTDKDQADKEKETHTSSDSDEVSRDPKIKKTPHSRKKLKYPKEAKIINEQNKTSKVNDGSICQIEIEIEPMPKADSEKDEEENNEKVTEEHDKDIIIEIPESPIRKKKESVSQNTTPKKNSPKECHSVKKVEEKKSTGKNDGQFIPIYQTFIDLCFELENSDDMQKIVEKKIKAYYLQVPKDYTESDEFIEMVSCKVEAMKASPERMYLYIKDIVDELNTQRKLAKSQLLRKEKEPLVSLAPEVPIDEEAEETEEDIKRKKHVRKLEKTLKKLHRAIHKLEEQEVDFDDDADSVYLLTDRYKERLVRVHAKLCQLSNTKMPSEPRLHLEPRPGRPSGPAKRLEKWINRRVPLGAPLPFPDFHDVLRCVRQAADDERLAWPEHEILEEARDLFTRCGRKLQRRRQENEWRLAAARVASTPDPAETSEELRRRLDDNRRRAAQREADLINKYADKQNQMKLEAVEIGDKEADESPFESGDEGQDELNDEKDSLENKEGRKECIKRLLKEKTRLGAEASKDTNREKEKSKKNIACDEKDVEMKDKDENSENNKEENDDCVKSPTIDADKSETTSIKDVKSQKDNNTTDNADDAQVLSDDSRRVDSDVDELHLLEKLHSGSEAASTLETSDSDTPIAISDTLASSDEIGNKPKQADEIVSIENSTESEEEQANTEHEIVNKLDENSNDHVENLTDKQQEITEDKVVLEEIQSVDESSQEQENVHHVSNDEYVGPVEDILLASTDEESNGCKVTETPNQVNSNNSNDVCINLKDDALSIGETVIERVDDIQSIEKSEKVTNEKPFEKEEEKVDNESKINQVDSNNINDVCINLKDDAQSIGETVIERVDDVQSIENSQKVINEKSLEKEQDKVDKESKTNDHVEECKAISSPDKPTVSTSTKNITNDINNTGHGSDNGTTEAPKDRVAISTASDKEIEIPENSVSREAKDNVEHEAEMVTDSTVKD